MASYKELVEKKRKELGLPTTSNYATDKQQKTGSTTSKDTIGSRNAADGSSKVSYKELVEQKRKELELPKFSTSRNETETKPEEKSGLTSEQRRAALMIDLEESRRAESDAIRRFESVGDNDEDIKMLGQIASEAAERRKAIENQLKELDFEDKYSTKTYDDNFLGQAAASFTVGNLSEKSNKAWYDYLQDPSEENRWKKDLIDTALQKFQTNNEATLADDATLPWVSQSLAGYLPQLGRQIGYSAAGGAMGAAAGSAVPVIGTGLGLKAGITAGSGLYSYQSMRGAAFRELVNAGMDEETAMKASADEAVLSAIIEMGDTAFDIATLGGGTLIKNLLSEGAEAAVKNSGKKRLLKALGGYGLNIAGEMGEEGAQQAVSIANKNRDSANAGGLTGVLDLTGNSINTLWEAAHNTDSDNWNEIWGAAKEGGKIAAMMGGAQGAVNFAANEAVTRQRGSAVNAEGDVSVQQLIEMALETEEGTESREMAEQMQTRYAAGENFSNREVGKLYNATVDSVSGGRVARQESTEQAPQHTSEQTSDGHTELAKAAMEMAGVETEERTAVAEDSSATHNNATVTPNNTTEIPNNATPVVNNASQNVRNATETTNNATADPIAQKAASVRKLTEEFVSLSTGYGEHGSRAVMEVMESENLTAPEARRMVETSYELGYRNQTVDTTRLNDVQMKAYEAGKLDAAAQGQKNAATAAASAVHQGGIDTSHKDSDNLYVTRLKNTQPKVYAAVDKLGKATGTRIVFDKSLRGGMSNGSYISKTGEIHIAPDAQNPVMQVMRHEVTHRMKDTAPSAYAAFRNEALQVMGEGAVENMKAQYLRDSNGKVRLTTEGAMDEIAALYAEKILTDDKELGNFIEKGKQNAQNRSMVQKFFDAIHNFVAKIKSMLNDDKASQDAAAMQEFGVTIEQLERAEQLWKDALAESEQNVKAKQQEQKTQTKTEAKSAVTETDGVVTNAKGEPVAMLDDDHHAQFSLKTYKEGGRYYLLDWLKKKVKSKDITQTDADDIVNQLDAFYEICKKYEGKYAPFGAWSNAEVVMDEKGKPVFSVVKKNGEYSMNLDFSLVCKKRRTLDAVFSEMIDRGMLEDRTLSEEEIVKINDIIRENGFETACALCFVDSKRYRQAKVAESFEQKYNTVVNLLIPEDGSATAHRFNFMDLAHVKNEGKGIHELSDAELKAGLDRVRAYMKQQESGTVPWKIAKHILAHPEDRKLVSRAEFMNTKGFEAVTLKNPEVIKLYNSSKGSGGPKAAFSDVQYLGDILKKQNFNAKKAYKVGGVRIQSFSDYVPRLVFDYLQMIGDLAAKKLPAHAYTKEALFAQQFGMTGIKINLSLVPAVDPKGVAPGLDADGNYLWKDGQSFGSDVQVKGSGQTGFDLAVKIQNAKGYSANCGTIAVGVSHRHIRKMLNDPDIRMIIPYHKSSLNHIVAVMNNIDQYVDYTGVQNTRRLNDKGEWVKLDGVDFNYNEALRKLGDAKLAANAYLEWCKTNNFLPKFNEFTYGEGSENYYKLLEDFSTYDNGVAAPQGAVTMTFPKKGDAFGSMEDLIKQGLEEDALLEGRRDRDVPKIVDQIGEVLGDQAETKSDRDYMNAVNRGDMKTAQRMVDEAAERAFPKSVLRGEDGKLIKVYHGSRTNFNVFSDRDAYYFSPWKRYAAEYGGNVRAFYLNITNPIEYDNDFEQLNDVSEDSADGYIWNGEDMEGGIDQNRIGDTEVVVYNSNQIKSADPVTYDENGNVIPLSERFNAENEDIRYSLRNQSDIVKESADRRAVNTALRRAYKNGEIVVMDKPSLQRMTKRMMDSVGSKASVKDMTERVTSLYEYIVDGENGDRADFNTAYELAYAIGTELAESAVAVEQDDYQDMKELRDVIRKTGITINKAYDHDLIGYESINEFRKANSGRIKLTNDGIPVDSFYQELATSFPGYFNESEYTTQPEQLMHIAEVLDGLKPTEYNPYEGNTAEAASWFASDLLMRIYGMQNDRIADVIIRNEEKAARAVKRESAKRAEAVKKVRTKYKDRDLRDRIERHAADLRHKLLRPSDKHHIPDEYRGLVLAVLDSINLESKYDYVYDADGKRTRVERATIVGAEMTKRTQAFSALKDRYTQLAEEGDMVVDPDLIGDAAYGPGKLDKIVAMGDTPIANMNSDQLQLIWDVIRSLEHGISNAGKTLSKAKYANTAAWAEAITLDTGSRRTKKGSAAERFRIDLENPLTFFSHYGEAGKAIFRMLRDAQDRQQQMVSEVKAEVQKIVDKNSVEKWERDIHTFTTDRGDNLTLSTAHIMEIYLLLKREQAQDHLLKGGIVQPEIEGILGKRKKINRGTDAVLLTFDDLAKIIKTLTKEQIQVADGLQQLTSSTLAEYGNEASMKAYGYRKFTGKDYWTIKSAQEGVHSNVEKGGNNTRSIKNIGLAKSTVPHANNPLDIGGVFKTFSAHAGDMIDYAAWLCPMEDASRLYNFKFKGTGKTMKGLLDRYGGKGAQQYWSRLMEDIQNGLSATNDSEFLAPINKVIGNVKGASVGANIRVIVQQPTAMLRAAVVLNPVNMTKGLAKGVTEGSGWQKALKYSAIAQRKDMGGFDISSPMQMNEILFDSKDKLQRFNELMMEGAAKADSLTWGRIWNACEWEIADATELKAGTEEFYEAVAEKFTEVIDQSQVVDGVLQRSQTMRSGNAIMKQATAFMGEPTMTLNMLLRAYDAFVNTDGKERSEARKFFGRTAAVLAVTTAVNALAQSIVDGWRDDEEEEDYLERVGTAFAENLLQGLNPIGYIPIAKDAISILEGYNVTRADADVMGDIITAFKSLADSFTADGKKTVFNASWNLIKQTSKVFGVSAGNIVRDVHGIVRSIASETDSLEVEYFMERAIYKLNGKNQSRFMNILWRAYEQGDTDLYEKMVTDMIDNGIEFSTIQSGMRSRAKAAGVDASDLNDIDYLAGLKLKNPTVKEEEEEFTVNDLADPLAYQRDFDKTSMDIYSDFLLHGYHNLDAETQNKMLEAAYDYAHETALAKHSGGQYQISTEWILEAQQSGLDIGTYIMYNKQSTGLSKMEKLDLMDDMNLRGDEYNALLEAAFFTATDKKKLDVAALGADQYDDYTREFVGVYEDVESSLERTRSWNSYDEDAQDKMLDYAETFAREYALEQLSRGRYDSTTEFNYVTVDDVLGGIRAGLDEGEIFEAIYIKGTLPGIKDKNGNTVTNSKKDQFIAWMQKKGWSRNKQKAMLQAVGYSTRGF